MPFNEDDTIGYMGYEITYLATIPSSIEQGWYLTYTDWVDDSRRFSGPYSSYRECIDMIDELVDDDPNLWNFSEWFELELA